MCGIVGVFDLKAKSADLRVQVLDMAKRIRHRGPDWSGIFCDDKAILAHERLSIVDPQSGRQPLYSKDRNLVLAVNGEIYNHLQIRKRFENRYEFQTNSDCEVILALYQEKGPDFLEELNGIFAFALYDRVKDIYVVGRDHMGIIPLYQGWDQYGSYYVASELKALEGYCNKIEVFLPGHSLCSTDGVMKPWYKRDWMAFDAVEDSETDIAFLRKSLKEAVHRQLMSDVP